MLGRKLGSVALIVFALCVGLLGCSSDDSSRDGGSSAGTSAGGTSGGTGAAGTDATAGTSSAAGTDATAGTSSAAGTDGTAGTGALPDFDAGTDPGRNMVDAAQLCDRLTTIQCAGEAHCCVAPGRSVEQCKTEMMDGCVNEAYLNAIAANAITAFSPDAAAAAFTQFEMMASQCDPSIAAWGSSVTGLRGILLGTKAPGDSCKPPTLQLTNPAAAAAALASCTDLATHACLPTGLATAWTCAPKNSAGGACFTDINCQDGLYCPNPDAGFSATCAARKAEGAGCGLPKECASLFCKGGKCVAQEQQAAYCLRN